MPGDRAGVDERARGGALARCFVRRVMALAEVVGLIVPGVIGTPFLIMGALVLWPGTRERVQHWWEGQPPKFLHGSMKQINRFLDDLERCYPRIEKR